MNRILKALAPLATMAALAGPAAASCDINFTLNLPAWYPTGNFPLDGAGRVVQLGPEVWVELETLRRTGDWEPAELSLPARSSGVTLHTPLSDGRAGRRPGQNRIIYSSRHFRLAGGPHVMPEIIFLRAALQGAGCAADRQFRVRYRCHVREARGHVLSYGRAYNNSTAFQTDVLFGGSRVAPRDINHTIRCPRAG